LEGTSPVGRITIRFPTGFGSSNRLFIGGCFSEGLFNYSRVFGNSLIGGVLEGASLVGKITLRFSGVNWSLERLSKVGRTSEETSPNSRHTIINNGAYWFLERLSIVRDSTGIVVVITAFEVFDYTLVL
jgi:hypothetical protein